MKEGIRKPYRKFSWEFTDYLSWRPQLRGNSKHKQKKLFTKVARNLAKKFLRKQINEL